MVAAEFGKLIADETEKWAKVIRAGNIKPEWPIHTPARMFPYRESEMRTTTRGCEAGESLAMPRAMIGVSDEGPKPAIGPFPYNPNRDRRSTKQLQG